MTVKLAQLIGNVEKEVITPAYQVRNLEEFRERQESPKVEFYGFQDTPEDYRGLLHENVRGNFKQLVTNNWRVKSLDSLDETLQGLREREASYGFKNFHAFWTKDYWNFNVEKPTGMPIDVISAGSLLLIATVAPAAISVGMIVGQGLIEPVRRVGKRKSGTDVKELEKTVETYDNIKDNIERSELYIKEPPSTVIGITDSITTTKAASPYHVLDLHTANRDLLEAYGIAKEE